VEAENIIDAGEGAREWWQEQIEKSQKSIGELLVFALGSFMASSIFLGLMRVTRWIVTGR
jgi:hypothetical protein